MSEGNGNVELDTGQSEILQRIITACPPEYADRVEKLLLDSYGFLDQLRELDFRSYEFQPALDAVQQMLEGPAKEVLEIAGEVILILAALPGCVSGSGRAPEVSSDLHEETIDQVISNVTQGSAVEGTVEPFRDRFCEELDQNVEKLLLDSKSEGGEFTVQNLGGYCGNLCDELNATRDRLKDMCEVASKWGIITEGEEVRRKLQKALRAAFTIAIRTWEPIDAGELFPHDPSELENALTIRATLVSFRNDMHGFASDVDEVSDEEIGQIMKEQQVRLHELFDNMVYSLLRSLDRYNLQDLNGRMTCWLENGSAEPAEGRRIIDAMRDFTDVLTNINRRATLARHDRTVRDAALSLLRPVCSTGAVTKHIEDSYSNALDILKGLAWRSSQLDKTVADELEVTRRAPEDLVYQAQQLVFILDEMDL